MKLFASFSEAIREGAPLRPQGFGWTFAEGRTCSIGAGLEAMGCLEWHTQSDPSDASYQAINASYPYLMAARPIFCSQPCGEGSNKATLYSHIVHLNDDHKMSREAIADWLEREEEKLGFVTLTDERKASGRDGSAVVAECPMVAHKGLN